MIFTRSVVSLELSTERMNQIKAMCILVIEFENILFQL